MFLVLSLISFPGYGEEKQKLRLTLEESLKAALEHNLNIRIARLTRDSLEPEVERARAIYHPDLGVSFISSAEHPVNDLGPASDVDSRTASGFISQFLPTGGLLILSNDISKDKPETPPNEVTSDVTVSIVQPLMRGGRVYVASRPISDAEYDVRVEEARLRAAVLRVVADTKTAYYNLNLAVNIIDVIKAAIKRDESLIEASEALFKAGMVTIRDVISARVSLAQDSERLVTSEADAESAKNVFLDVTGLSLDAEVELLDREIRFEPVPMEPERWIATAVRDRPEVAQLEEQLSKSLLNVRVSRNVLLPQLDFTGSYSKAQTSSTVSKAYGLRGDAWSAGLVFSIPLGNVAARAGLTRAEIEHSRLQEQLLQQKRQVELEVRAAEITLRNSLARIDALTKILEHSKKLYEVAKERFALGLATNLDITDAQEDMLNAETDLLQAIVNYNAGLAELEAAIAGPLTSQ